MRCVRNRPFSSRNLLMCARLARGALTPKALLEASRRSEAGETASSGLGELSLSRAQTQLKPSIARYQQRKRKRGTTDTSSNSFAAVREVRDAPSPVCVVDSRSRRCALHAPGAGASRRSKAEDGKWGRACGNGKNANWGQRADERGKGGGKSKSTRRRYGFRCCGLFLQCQ